MTPIMNYVFARNATSPTDTGRNPDGSERICSDPFTNNRCDVIAIEISGDFTAASVIFEGKADLKATEYTPVVGINVSDFSYGTTVTKKGIWELDIAGIQVFRARIVSVSGGSITILGRCVSTAN